MNFKRDLLLIDLETTGLDVNRHEMIQLAAVLLDKKNLKEKMSFNTYIKPAKWQNRDKESMNVNKIAFGQIKDAPTLRQVVADFKRTFPKKVTLSYYAGIMDIAFLQKAFLKAKAKWPFDYHYFNVWGLFYSYLALKNRLTSKKDYAGFGLESLIKMFKIKLDENQLHDALVDCRVEAEILRRVTANIRILGNIQKAKDKAYRQIAI